MSILFIFKGITLEYTISNIIYVYGTFKGSMLSVAMLLITNLIYLPLMIKVGVSTRKSYFNLINYNANTTSNCYNNYYFSNWYIYKLQFGLRNIKKNYLILKKWLYFLKIIWYNIISLRKDYYIRGAKWKNKLSNF